MYVINWIHTWHELLLDQTPTITPTCLRYMKLINKIINWTKFDIFNNSKIMEIIFNRSTESL